MEAEKTSTSVEEALQGLLEESDRQREMIADLLAQIGAERRTAERGPFDLTLHFVSQADIVRARGLDASDTGVGVEIESPLPFLLRIKIDGATQLREVQLMWAKCLEDGSQRLGFRYLDEPPQASASEPGSQG